MRVMECDVQNMKGNGMKRETPKKKMSAARQHNANVKHKGKKVLLLSGLLTILCLSAVQAWMPRTVEGIDKNGDFFSRVEGWGVFAFLYEHLYGATVILTLFYFLSLIAVIFPLTINWFAPTAVPIASLVLTMILGLAGVFSIVTPMMNDSVPKEEMYAEHMNIEEPDVESNYVDAGELRTLKSTLKSEAPVTVPDNGSVKLVLIQDKNGEMTVYAVEGEPKNTDDFISLGTVDDDDKLQVQTFFNSL